MTDRCVRLVLLLVLSSGVRAFAQPQLTANGTTTTVYVPGGATVAVAVSNGPGNPMDLIGMYAVGGSVLFRAFKEPSMEMVR